MELALVDEKLANLTVGMPEKTQKEIMVWVKQLLREKEEELKAEFESRLKEDATSVAKRLQSEIGEYKDQIY